MGLLGTMWQIIQERNRDVEMALPGWQYWYWCERHGYSIV